MFPGFNFELWKHWKKKEKMKRWGKVDSNIMHLWYSNKSKQRYLQKKTQKRKKRQKNQESEKRKSVVDLTFPRNALQYKWLCLRRQMAIFHLPFSSMKIFICYPFEPVESFSKQTLTKDHPQHWGGNCQKGFFQE